MSSIVETSPARAPQAPQARRGTADVVRLRDEDHRWAARLHVEELPHGLFPRLGRRFVETWHRAHADSPYAVVLTSLVDGVPAGFAIGSTDRVAHVGWLLEHRRGVLVRAALRALAVRPAVLADFVRTRAGRYARRLLGRPAATPAGAVAAPTGEGSQARQPVAVLEAIIVLAAGRGRGTGTALTEAFLTRAAAAGTQRVELVTMAGDAGAAGFYERRGWRQVGAHADRDGRGVLTYRTYTGTR